MVICNCIANPICPFHSLKLCQKKKKRKFFVYIIFVNTNLVGVILVHVGVDS